MLLNLPYSLLPPAGGHGSKGEMVGNHCIPCPPNKSQRFGWPAWGEEKIYVLRAPADGLYFTPQPKQARCAYYSLLVVVQVLAMLVRLQADLRPYKKGNNPTGMAFRQERPLS